MSLESGLTNKILKMTGYHDTHYGALTTQTRLQSETADNITWARYATPSANENHPARVTEALTRVTFSDLSVSHPLQALVERASAEGNEAAQRERSLLVVLGRSRRLAVQDHAADLKTLVEKHGAVGGEVRKTIGDVAAALVVVGLDAGLVVVQTSMKNHDL